jgi:hypothetical protein
MRPNNPLVEKRFICQDKTLQVETTINEQFIVYEVAGSGLLTPLESA